jgi:hypothetical protein
VVSGVLVALVIAWIAGQTLIGAPPPLAHPIWGEVAARGSPGAPAISLEIVVTALVAIESLGCLQPAGHRTLDRFASISRVIGDLDGEGRGAGCGPALQMANQGSGGSLALPVGRS